MKFDRFTKTLLTLLVVGVWGLLLSPFFYEQPAIAQSHTVQYEFTYVSGNNVDVQFQQLSKLGLEGFQIVAERDGNALWLQRRLKDNF